MLLNVGLSSLMIDCLLLIHAMLQIITDKKKSPMSQEKLLKLSFKLYISNMSNPMTNEEDNIWVDCFSMYKRHPYFLN